MPTSTPHPSYISKLETQSYKAKPVIEGVEKVTLQYHCDDGGAFCELYRLENGVLAGLRDPFSVAQVSFSIMQPSVIKAYHIHYHQDDLWFVPPSQMVLVNLHDLRKDSPSYDTHMRLVLGGCTAELLRIPAGVAHGVGNPYDMAAMLFYATTAQFDASNPDEHRLAWDTFGTQVWELSRG
jgi:dTDP-4-dehydrorhamnose 3,5-epimerase